MADDGIAGVMSDGVEGEGVTEVVTAGVVVEAVVLSAQ